MLFLRVRVAGAIFLDSPSSNDPRHLRRPGRDSLEQIDRATDIDADASLQLTPISAPVSAVDGGRAVKDDCRLRTFHTRFDTRRIREIANPDADLRAQV